MISEQFAIFALFLQPLDFGDHSFKMSAGKRPLKSPDAFVSPIK